MPLHQALIYIKNRIENLIQTDYQGVYTYLDAINKEELKEGVYVSLLYAEEEKTLKNNEYLQTYYDKENDPKSKTIIGYRKVNPKIYLNLYVLIASCHSPYEEALKHISQIISSFRQKSVFNKADDLKDEYSKLDKLIFDIHTLSFEQNNSLWQSIGSKLYPYVVYKVKTIAFAEVDEELPITPPIQKILGLLEHFTADDSPGRVGTENTTPTEQEIDAYTLLTDKEGNKVIIVNSRELYDKFKKRWL